MPRRARRRRTRSARSSSRAPCCSRAGRTARARAAPALAALRFLALVVVAAIVAARARARRLEATKTPAASKRSAAAVHAQRRRRATTPAGTGGEHDGDAPERDRRRPGDVLVHGALHDGVRQARASASSSTRARAVVALAGHRHERDAGLHRGDPRRAARRRGPSDGLAVEDGRRLRRRSRCTGATRALLRRLDHRSRRERTRSRSTRSRARELVLERASGARAARARARSAGRASSRVRDARRFEELRVHARRGEAGHRVELVQHDLAVARAHEEVDAGETFALATRRTRRPTRCCTSSIVACGSSGGMTSCMPSSSYFDSKSYHS